MLSIESAGEVILPAVVLFCLVVFVAVFLIIYCIDCGGKKSEYEKLDREYLESRDTAVQQKKHLQMQRTTAWTDAQYYVRSLPKCKVLGDYDLWEMGYRKERTNFLIKFENRLCLMSMITPGENCTLPLKNEPGRKIFKKALSSLKHPFIQQPYKIDFWIDQSKAVVISHFNDEGSIRDNLYKSKPTGRWQHKYENPTKPKPQPLSRGKIPEYGRQILEALLYMKESGVPYTHLHAGNVIIKDEVARIINLENGLLSLERQNERLYRQFCKKQPTKFEKIDIDTLSFGALIYEMATGETLKNLSQIDNYPNNSPKEVLEVLNLIFKDSDKFPTLEDIVNLPYFANVKLRNYTKLEPVAFDDKEKKILAGAIFESKQLQGGIHGSKRKPGPNTRKPTPKRPPAKPLTISQQSATSPSKTSSVPSTPLSSSVASPSKVPPPPVSPSKVPPPPVSPSKVPPPPVAPTAPAAPPPPATLPPPQSGRNDLMSSIRGFSGGLKKTKTNDRSGPIL